MVKETPKRFWVGFDLGGTKMQATVFDDTLQQIGKKRRKTRAHEGQESVLTRIVGAIAEAIDNAGITSAQVAAIGVGSPGPLDPDKGIILDSPNLGWKRVRLRSRLRKEFRCPVFVINDVDAGTYAEYVSGAAVGSRCVLGVFPGTGIGGGCVYKGEILTGKGINSLEIGHMCVQPDGVLCGCGRRGCLETVASRLAVSAAAAAAAYRGEAPHLLENAGMDLSNIRSGALAASIAAGDHSVELVVREAGRWLGVGIGSVVNLLAPDIVVLGGGLVEAIPEILLEEAGKSARAHAMPSFEKRFRLAVAVLGDDATVVGAAAWAKRSIDG